MTARFCFAMSTSERTRGFAVRIPCPCRRRQLSICCGEKKMARLHAPEFLILYNFTFGRFYICVLRSVVSRPCALSLFVERSRFLSHVGSVWSVVSRPSARSLFYQLPGRLFGSRPLARICFCRPCLPRCIQKPKRPRLRDLLALRLSEHVADASTRVCACCFLQCGHADRAAGQQHPAP